MPTVIVSLIVAAILVLAILQLRRDKKAGKPL
ncbi:MAG: FeoB-associated Cys-rich membrane protein [Ruminiclostridium sp.]|nr:FeoB-associated Cys-rich membrane protein [Ruminiclostridium sp.]